MGLSAFTADSMRNHQGELDIVGRSYNDAAMTAARSLFGCVKQVNRVTGEHGDGLFQAFIWDRRFCCLDEIGACFYIKR